MVDIICRPKRIVPVATVVAGTASAVHGSCVMSVQPIMVLVSSGHSVHFNGMVCTLTPNGVEVAWVNLPGVPKVVLNCGDAAFNYVDAKMVTFTGFNDSGEAVLMLDGVKSLEQITECIVASDGLTTEFFGGKDVGQRDIRERCRQFALNNYYLYNTGVY